MLADLVTLTLAGGLAAGYLDRLALELRSVTGQPLIFVGSHSWWTGPVATVLFFAIAMAGLRLAAALVRRRDRLWPAAIWVFGFLTGFAALYSFPQIHRLVALLLSATAATLLTRLAGAATPARRRQVRWTAALLSVTTLGIAGAGLAREALRERRLNQTAAAAPAAPAAASVDRHDHRTLNGMTANELIEHFGRPRLQIREGDGTKLQFAGPTCVLDFFLYPGQGGVPRVSHIDARNLQGGEFNSQACVHEIEGDRGER